MAMGRTFVSVLGGAISTEDARISALVKMGFIGYSLEMENAFNRL
jgi:hypothetical protein